MSCTVGRVWRRICPRHPVLLLFALSALLLTACTTPQPGPTATDPPAALTVFAAASLTEPFTELGRRFEARQPDVAVRFNFAGSQHLAGQLSQGAPGDVFASADQRQMDMAVESGRTVQSSRRTFACNRLMVVYPADNPGHVTALADLARPGLRLVLAAQTVPVGQYALDFLDKADQDTALGAAFRRAVLDNIVSYEENVKAVLSKVVLGEADAGIVYSSDVTPQVAAKVGQIPIPAPLNTLARYPIAPMVDSLHPSAAAAFIELVLSDEGQTVLANHGFIPVAECGAVKIVYR